MKITKKVKNKKIKQLNEIWSKGNFKKMEDNKSKKIMDSEDEDFLKAPKYYSIDLIEYEGILYKKYKALLEEESNPKEENVKELIDVKIKDVLKTLLENFDGFFIYGFGNCIIDNVEEAENLFYKSKTLKLLQDRTTWLYKKDTDYIYKCFEDEIEHGVIIQREYLNFKRTLDKLKDTNKMPNREEEIEEYENFLDKKHKAYWEEKKKEEISEESMDSEEEKAILKLMKDNGLDRFEAEDVFYKYGTIEVAKESMDETAEDVVLLLMKDTGLSKEESENLLHKSKVYKLIQNIGTGMHEEDPYFIYETMLQDEMKYGSIVQREF